MRNTHTDCSGGCVLREYKGLTRCEQAGECQLTNEYAEQLHRIKRRDHQIEDWAYLFLAWSFVVGVMTVSLWGWLV